MADDTKPNAASLALLNAQMDSLAREVGALNPDDPEARRSRQRDLSLTELAAEMRRAFNEMMQ